MNNSEEYNNCKFNYNNFTNDGQMEQKLEANMNDTRTEKNPKNSF